MRREHLKDAGTVETLLRVMADIATAYPDSFTVDPVALARRLGVRFDPRHPPDCGSDFGDCRELWPRQIAQFRRRAMAYYLYR